MKRKKPQLLYFEKWMTGDAPDKLNEVGWITLINQSFENSTNEHNKALREAHGYQLLPKTELDERFFVTEELIQKMPKLIAACSTGAGYDMIDVAACTKAGIIVCNQSGANTEAVAEHVFGFILSLSKKIVIADRAMHTTDRVNRFLFDGNDIFEKTLGIVGLGNIGTRVCEISKAFNMRVIAYDPYLSKEKIKQRGAIKVAWGELFSSSDFVTIHCPLNEETINMIDLLTFSLMKKSAFFITTARGGVHIENDLIKVLSNKSIAGAGIDVWYEEPTPISNELLSFDNVISTPHCAGMTQEAMKLMGTHAAEQWIDIFKGRQPVRLVNPEAWGKFQSRFKNEFNLTPVTLSNQK